MGLDMYLTAKLHTSEYSNAEFYNEVDKVNVPWPVTDISPYNDSYMMSKDVVYWRKANAIHKWFVDNCQGGVDDCRSAYVSLEKLTELRDLCREALKAQSVDIAASKLPTAQGFFFGSTNYDSYYWEDIFNTEKALTAILENKFCKNFEYFYSSSW